MRIAHDIYSETNPAFWAFALLAFIDAYTVTKGQGPDLPIAYLALPIALSADLGPSFDGTNKKTGLQVWLQRRPEVQVALAARVNASLGIVTDAIRLSAFSGVAVVGADGRLGMGQHMVKAGAIKALSEGPAQAIKRAARVGCWFADAGSTRTVFDMMGLTV